MQQQQQQQRGVQWRVCRPRAPGPLALLQAPPRGAENRRWPPHGRPGIPTSPPINGEQLTRRLPLFLPIHREHGKLGSTMTNFPKRALMRRKRQQNGDAAGGGAGGRDRTSTDSKASFQKKPTLNSSSVSTALTAFVPPAKRSSTCKTWDDFSWRLFGCEFFFFLPFSFSRTDPAPHFNPSHSLHTFKLTPSLW